MEHCWGKKMQQTTSEVTVSTLWNAGRTIVATCDLILPRPMLGLLTDAWFRPRFALTLVSLQLTGNPPGGQPAELGFGGGHLIQSALSSLPRTDPLQMQDYSSATGNESPIAPLYADNGNSQHGRLNTIWTSGLYKNSPFVQLSWTGENSYRD